MDANEVQGVTAVERDVRAAEWRSFLFLTAVMVPVLTVLIIAGYGFAVWMFQVVAGPPSGA